MKWRKKAYPTSTSAIQTSMEKRARRGFPIFAAIAGSTKVRTKIERTRSFSTPQ